MLAVFRDLRILLMGDLEKEGEAKFVRDLQASRLFPSLSGQGKLVLIAGHHGSKYATSEALLEMVKPDAVLISCGKNNRYGHPAGEMLRRLEQARIPYHRTDLEGAIRVSN
jgi:competence protein ComEC